MKVSDLMTRKVATVRITDGLHVAARLMRNRDCGCIVVVEKDAKVVGVLSDRDICLTALRTDRPLSRLLVRAAISPGVFTCQCDDSIESAERLMGQHQVRRLPVVNAENRLQGLISLDDIAREALREEDLIAPPVTTRMVGKTLGEITRPSWISKGSN